MIETATTHRTVADVMSGRPITVRVDAGFKEIASLLTTYRISALPVVSETNAVLGIVSEADLLLKETYPDPEQEHHLLVGRARRRDLAKAAGLVAADLMTAPAVTIAETATLGEAARTMHDRNVKRLPVVDHLGRLVGIVSRGDLLRVFLRPDGEIRRDVVEEVLIKTLWMDPAGIDVEVRDGLVTLRGMVDRKSDAPILIKLIHGIDGVIGVKESLSHRFDDTPAAFEIPWSIFRGS